MRCCMVDRIYKSIFNRVALSLLIVSRKRDMDGLDTSIVIQAANTHAEKTLNLVRDEIVGCKLSDVLPMADCELRFGSYHGARDWEVFDTLNGIECKIIIRPFEQDFHWIEIHTANDFDEKQTELIQLINSLKSQVLRFISKEAFYLRENSYLKKTMNNLPFIVTIKDQHLRYRYANKAFCHLTGLELFILLGKTDQELYSEENANSLMKGDNQVLESFEPFFGEIHFSEANGKRHILYTHKKRIVDNKGSNSIIMACMEITDSDAAPEAEPTI